MICQETNEILQELRQLNGTAAKIFDIIPKQESRLDKFMDFLGKIVTILGILGIIDIIKQWLTTKSGG